MLKAVKISLFLLIIHHVYGINNLINSRVETIVNLDKKLLKLLENITFYNNDSKPTKSYFYHLNETDLYDVGFFQNPANFLNFTRINSSLLEVELEHVLNPNKTDKLYCYLTIADRIVPVGKKRYINDDQLVKYLGNAYFSSPYPTEFMQVHFLIKTNQIMEITKHPHSMADDYILYFFENVAPYTNDPLEIVFVNNNAFLKVERYERVISVSHFNNIFIEDHVFLKNIGPQLVGEFNANIKDVKAASHWLFTHLPASAKDFKFFDEIGNNSYTNVIFSDDYITLKFATRYKLFGGWKSNYFLQYKVPTFEYLFKSSLPDTYVLQIRGIDHILDDVTVENVIVKIQLPEGAVIRKYESSDVLTYSGQIFSWDNGLHLFGQPTLVFNSTRLLVQYSQIQVEYYLHPVFMLKAPFILIVYVEFVFVVILVSKYQFF